MTSCRVRRSTSGGTRSGIATPAYMSLTAVSTGAGAGGRSGLVGRRLDGEGWYMMTAHSAACRAGRVVVVKGLKLVTVAAAAPSRATARLCQHGC